MVLSVLLVQSSPWPNYPFACWHGSLGSHIRFNPGFNLTFVVDEVGL